MKQSTIYAALVCASKHIVTQHNLLSTASDEERLQTINRLIDWNNGVMYLMLGIMEAGNDRPKLLQLLHDADAMTAIIHSKLSTPFAEMRKQILTELRDKLAEI